MGLPRRLHSAHTPAIVLGVTLLATPMGLVAPGGLPKLRALEGALAQTQASNQTMRRQITVLQAEIDALRHDTQQQAALVRDELNLVREDEVVFVFGDERP